MASTTTRSPSTRRCCRSLFRWLSWSPSTSVPFRSFILRVVATSSPAAFRFRRPRIRPATSRPRFTTSFDSRLRLTTSCLIVPRRLVLDLRHRLSLARVISSQNYVLCDVLRLTTSCNSSSRDVSSYNVSSQVARESIADIELTSTLPAQTVPPGGVSQTVVTAEKAGFLRPRLDTHPNSPDVERSTAEVGERAARRSTTLTSRFDDAITHHHHQQPGQQQARLDHLRVHGGRPSRGYIRTPAAGRNSVGAVKMHGRERRAGRTLIWVFAIFVALWLPFFCTNLAYGVCGVRHDHTTASVGNTSRQSATTRTTTTVVFAIVPESTATTNRSTSDVFGGNSAGCNIPESVFIAFTWLGYLSSGVNPLVYTLLNHDFQNAFRTIITCRYFSATSASRRQSHANLFN